MIRTEVIIGVKDVQKSSEWYQTLLGCKGVHGGDTFEILADKDDDTVILCLHRWGAHEHSTLTSPKIKPGNGLILFFKVDDLNEAWDNARHLYAIIEEVPHLNENSGKEEFSLRDMDGYYVTISANS